MSTKLLHFWLLPLGEGKERKENGARLIKGPQGRRETRPSQRSRHPPRASPSTVRVGESQLGAREDWEMQGGGVLVMLATVGVMAAFQVYL